MRWLIIEVVERVHVDDGRQRRSGEIMTRRRLSPGPQPEGRRGDWQARLRLLSVGLLREWRLHGQQSSRRRLSLGLLSEWQHEWQPHSRQASR